MNLLEELVSEIESLHYMTLRQLDLNKKQCEDYGPVILEKEAALLDKLIITNSLTQIIDKYNKYNK